LIISFSGRLYSRAVVPASTTLISQEEAALSFPWAFGNFNPYINSNNLQDNLSNVQDNLSNQQTVQQFEADTRPYMLERR
jgi:hypothetical protein